MTRSGTESAANVNLTWEDLDIIREAVIDWVSRPLDLPRARERAVVFAAFAVRHPELITRSSATTEGVAL